MLTKTYQTDFPDWYLREQRLPSAAKFKVNKFSFVTENICIGPALGSDGLSDLSLGTTLCFYLKTKIQISYEMTCHDFEFKPVVEVRIEENTNKILYSVINNFGSYGHVLDVFHTYCKEFKKDFFSQCCQSLGTEKELFHKIITHLLETNKSKIEQKQKQIESYMLNMKQISLYLP